MHAQRPKDHVIKIPFSCTPYNAECMSISGSMISHYQIAVDLDPMQMNGKQTSISQAAMAVAGKRTSQYFFHLLTKMKIDLNKGFSFEICQLKSFVNWMTAILSGYCAVIILLRKCI
jgi:uncharacterized protein YqkB